MKTSVKQYLDNIAKASTTTSLGGQLEPDDARKFLHTTLDQSGFLGTVTRQEVIASEANIEVMDIAGRSIRKTTENVEFSTDTNPTIKQRKLTKVGVKLAYTVTDEFLRGNIEKDDINAVLQDKFTITMGNDLNDLAVNGDEGSGDPFLSINDGWFDIAIADGSTNKVDATGMGSDWLNQILPAMYLALPNKWRKNKNELVFLVSGDNEHAYAEQLGSRETETGDQVIRTSGKLMYNGIPIESHPFVGDTVAMLTLRKNLHVGFGVEMSRESIRKPEIGQGATRWFINSEIDFNYGISEALVVTQNVGS